MPNQETRSCKYCGKEFTPKRNTKGRFCSRDCFRESWSKDKKVTLTCAFCNNLFQRYKTRLKSEQEPYYCNEHCKKEGQSKRIDFNASVFRFDIDDFKYRQPDHDLGNYQNVRKQRTKKYQLHEEFFSKGIHNEYTAYLFGIFLTDGSIMLRKRENGEYHELVRLKLCDRDIVEHTKEILGTDQPVKIYDYKHVSKQYDLSFNSSKLFHDLTALGCILNKTQCTEYPLISNHLDQHFIRGIIDGDGSWSTRKNRKYDLSLKVFGTDKLLYGVYLKVKYHLNIDPSNVYYPIDYDPNYKMKNYCVLTYGKINSLKIRDWIYEQSSVHGDRKYKIAWQY